MIITVLFFCVVFRMQPMVRSALFKGRSVEMQLQKNKDRQHLLVKEIALIRFSCLSQELLLEISEMNFMATSHFI